MRAAGIATIALLVLSGGLRAQPTVAQQQAAATRPAAPRPADALEKRLLYIERKIDELEARLAHQRLELVRGPEVRELIQKLTADAAARPAQPDWARNLTFSGDFRLRYQCDCFNFDRKSRNRLRFRLRLGAEKTFLDKQVELYFRLASGEGRSIGGVDGGTFTGGPLGQDPTTANQTFTDNFSRKPLWIDQAYARFVPRDLKGLDVIAGKFRPPMVHTEMIWDPNLTLEGAYAQYRTPGHDLDCKPLAGAGYFVANESSAGHDAVLAAYQIGFDWTLPTLTQGHNDWRIGHAFIRWIAAATLYDFDHLDVAFARSNASPAGNPLDNDRLAAGEFRVLNLTSRWPIEWFVFKVTPYVDYAVNCGDRDRAGEHGSTDRAWSAGVNFFENKQAGDVSFGYRYSYIEANALPGAFTDSDFGAGRKGHGARVTYNLTDFLTLSLVVFYTEPIRGAEDNQRRTDTRVELLWKF